MTHQRNNTSRQMEQRIGDIERSGMKAKGRKELVHHLEGRPLQRGQAIIAKCYECAGYFSDGKVDCLMPLCPLYRYMPYRGGSDN